MQNTICLFFVLFSFFASGCAKIDKTAAPLQTCTRQDGCPFKTRSVKSQVIIALKELPSIGVTSAGQELRLGGFSGLSYLGSDREVHRFVTLTDRGPNAEAVEGFRPFALPEFQPQLVWLEINTLTGRYKITQRRILRGPLGEPLNGLPPPLGLQAQERPTDVYMRELAPSLNGIDGESLVQDPRGGFWVGDEYGPALIRFSEEGVERERLTPGAGLPLDYAKRKTNRGFEGLAIHANKLIAFLQGPIPSEGLNGRILEIDILSRKTREFLYPFDSKETARIGDAVALANGQILVIERDDLVPSQGGSQKRVYRVTLKQENKPVKKEEVVDLVKAGFEFQKAEGLGLLPDGRLLIGNDNDFQVNGNVLGDGTFPVKMESSQFLLVTP